MMKDLRQLAATLAVLGLAGVSGSAQQVVTMSGGPGGMQVVPGGVLPGGPNATPDKPLEKGTGLIFGRTVEAGTGRPVPGTLVTLSFPGAVPVRVMTDPQGQFAFTSLPKGRFSLSATRPGYVDGAYGRVRPSGSSQSIDLSADQHVTGITIPLWKYAAIAGAVVDERGEPMVGATVRALKRSFSAGRRQLSMAGTDTTDDRGFYRIPSLEPGDYVVVVPVTQSSSIDSMLQGMGLPRDLAGGLPPGGGGAVAFTSTVRVGGSASGPSVITLGSDAGLPPAGKTEDGHLLTYQTEFYPGVLSGSRASTVTVGIGEERSGIDFQLKPVRAVSVSGTLIGPDGPSANTSLSLIPAEADDVVTSIETASAMTDGKGDFTFSDVPPGSYMLRVLKSPRMSFTPGQTMSISQGDTFMMQTVRTMSVSGAAPLPTEPTLWAESSVAVGTSDLAGLTVSLRPGMRVSGRVEFNGGATQPTPDQLPAISISLEPADGRTSGMASTVRGRIETSGRFTTMGVPVGKYVLRVSGAPKDWALLGAMFGGKDITSAAVELKSDDLDGVVITFTDRPTDLSGTVMGANGPDSGASVMVFPTDPSAWVGTGSAPRDLKSTRANDSGAYSFSNLPPGDYYIAAVSDALSADWQNPEFLTVLARGAQRIRISEGEKKTQALRTTTPPGRQQ